jgi:hypothetical protein
LTDALISPALLIVVVGLAYLGLRLVYSRDPGQSGVIDQARRPVSHIPVLGLSDADLRAYGDTWARLLCDGASWVIRRKEAVSLVDGGTVRRKTSIDFSVPVEMQSAAAAPNFGDRVLVPLLCLEKAPATFTRFDFADEDRSSLPLPTRHENGIVSAYILQAAARRALDAPLSKTLCQDLAAIAVLDPREAETHLDRVLGDGPVSPDEKQSRAPLRRDESFVWLATTLTYSSVVVVPVDRDTQQRRHIVKLSFDQRLDDRRSAPWLSRVPFLALGWEPLEIVTESPFVGAESYHFEAEVTPSIEILDALVVTSFRDEFVEINRVVARSPRVHVYVSNAADGQASVARIRYRVQRDTFLRGALVASGLITAVLAACVGFSDYIAQHSANLAGLLVAFPSAVVAYVLRGTGHDLATRLVWKARAVLFAVGLLPLIAGGRLAAERITDTTHPQQAALLYWWVPALALAVVGTTALAAANWFPRIPAHSEDIADRVRVESESVELH